MSNKTDNIITSKKSKEKNIIFKICVIFDAMIENLLTKKQFKITKL